MPVFGRSAEKELLNRVIDDGRTGRGSAAVVLGCVGIGKTALIDDVADGVAGTTKVRISRDDFDDDSPYSGLRGLITPFAHVVGELPEPQSKAMGLALRLRGDGIPDPFVLGLATLAVLRRVAGERPLLCIVDDAHLLDPASLRALTFAGRRLRAEKVALVFGARHVAAPPDWFDGLRTLHLDPLRDEECLRLLTSIAGDVDRFTTARVLHAAEGNPRAIVEYGRALTEWRSTDGLCLPDPLRITAKTRAEHARGRGGFSPAARWCLLIASAEPTGDIDLVMRAVRHLRIDPVEVDAEVSRFFDPAGKVLFPHPLTRSITYHSAPSQERILVHQALGMAAGPERRVWHRAAALAEPDESIAAELVDAAARARSRGGHVAESTFLTRAAELSPDDRTRVRRLTAAAQVAQLAGANELSVVLLDRASRPHASAHSRQDADRVRGAALTWSARAPQAATLLGAAVEEWRVRDERLACQIWIQAVNAALLACRGPDDPVLDRLVTAAQPMLSRVDHERGADEDVMRALATRLSRGRLDSVEPLRRALLPEADGETAQIGREPVLTNLMSLEIWDLVVGRRALQRMAADCRRDGALTGLYAGLVGLAHQEALVGRFHVAAEHSREAREVGARLGVPANRSGLACLMQDALCGRAQDVRATASAMKTDFTAAGYGLGAAMCSLALAVVEVAQGRYRKALDHAGDVYELDPPGVGNLVLPYLVEAAVRVDDRELAVAGLRRLEERVEAADSSWGRGVLDRCRALVASGSEAGALFATAAGWLDPDDLPLECARTHLLWGEWLRREGHDDSTTHLRIAHRMFTSMGSLPLAQRCAAESQAAGARMEEFGTWLSTGLTGQEKAIAELAARGLTNQAIATTLSVSANTIAYHLKKIYRKLGVESRRTLPCGCRSRSNPKCEGLVGVGCGGQPALVGRDAEHRAVLGLVERLRDGQGGALVLRGECGSGKTFLVEQVVESVTGVRVVRAPGIEAEEPLPYAALDRLLRPGHESLPDLSVRHRDALDTVFGERPGTASAAAVVLATSALLDRAGGSDLVLYLIDDAQWIDQVTGEVLSAVCGDGRRSIRSFLFCVRDQPEPGSWLETLPEVRLPPLDNDESLSLLASLSEDVDEFSAKRLVRIANGNPLALTRFVRDHVAGRGYQHSRSTEWFSLPERLETELLRSAGARSAPADLLLLLAAVEPSATMEDFRKAALVMGTEVRPDDVADLLSFEPRPVFRQPLLAQALVRRAAPVLRHRIHVALGLVLDDPDRRAWHVALSAHGHAETIARELEAAARRAEVLGAHRRAEACFRRSAELGDEDRRAGRLVSAARLSLLLKDYRSTRALLDEALLTPLDPDLRPDVSRIRAVLHARAGDDEDTLVALNDVLQDIALLDVRAAGNTWFETLDGALLAHGRMPHPTLGRFARHVLDAAPTSTGQRTPADVLTAGLAVRVTAGYVEAVPLMRRIAATLDTVDDADPAGWRCRRWQSLVALTLLELWDVERGARLLDLAVESGARDLDVRILRVTPFALARGHAAQWNSGEVTVPQTGGRRLVQVAVEAVAGAARGTGGARAKVGEVIVLARRAGYGFLVSLCHLLLVRIAISRGEYDDALVWSKVVYAQDAPGLGGQVLADLVESAVRVGDADVAAAAYARLAVRVRASDSAWGRGLQARAQALSAPDTHAERHFLTSIRLLEPTSAVLDAGRTRLLYGEWLRRQKRRTEAAQHLGQAYETFVALNADSFADRARAELNAAGARSEGERALTAQQQRVAQLAVEGLTRARIAVRLAISEHTVADHLKQVYRKLGIHSRGQLGEVLARVAGPTGDSPRP